MKLYKAIMIFQYHNFISRRSNNVLYCVRHIQCCALLLLLSSLRYKRTIVLIVKYIIDVTYMFYGVQLRIE